MESAGKIVVIYVVSLGLIMAGSTENSREWSGETFHDDQEIKSNNSSSLDSSLDPTSPPIELGMLDSHEAMNNRETPTKMREKRSYEFLMGLINNNSRYEVTKVDPSISKKKPEILDKDQAAEDPTSEEEEGNSVVASELLLELMVKIAAHPDQWDDVHELLQKIDEDLTVSKDILGKINAKQHHKKSTPFTVRPEYETNSMEKKINTVSTTTMKPVSTTAVTTETTSTQRATTKNLRKKDNLDWKDKEILPSPQKLEKNVHFVNSNDVSIEDKSVENTTQKQNKDVDHNGQSTTYPKNFAYHRVTGTPFNLNKNPMAYIAVSVIAPKPVNTVAKEDDVTLEKELHELKPWSHVQNLKNMQTIRSRWVIQSDGEDKNKPSL